MVVYNCDVELLRHLQQQLMLKQHDHTTAQDLTENRQVFRNVQKVKRWFRKLMCLGQVWPWGK